MTHANVTAVGITFRNLDDVPAIRCQNGLADLSDAELLDGIAESGLTEIVGLEEP